LKNKNDPRHKARCVTLAFIYARSLSKTETDISNIQKALQITKPDKDLILKLVHCYFENLKFLTEVTDKYLKGWNISQLLEIDIILIRLAYLECYILDNIGIKIAIDEYVELAKTYSSSTSGNFINGVLAKILSDKKALAEQS